MPRDPGDRPEPVAEQRPDRGEQHPVEPADERRNLDPFGPDRPEPLGPGVDGLDHPRLLPCSLKNCWKTLSAAGAAASTPKPPFSISAQTTSCGGSVEL